MPWTDIDLADVSIPPSLAVIECDNRFRRFEQERLRGLLDVQQFIGEGCPNVQDYWGDESYDHAYAGIVPYIFETGEFLLQPRDSRTPFNPGMHCIIGGRANPGEVGSIAAAREFEEETGIHVSAADLRPLYTHVERRRLAKPVLRSIFGLLLDKVPARIVCGEGERIVRIPVTLIGAMTQTITWLSREDIEYFLSCFVPRRAA